MKKIKLDELQLAIMQVLWSNGEQSVAQIQECLSGQKELAITTIATVLKRLEKKGIVSHREEGRKYIFQAVLSEEETKQSMVSHIVKQLFRGDSASLVNHLIKENEFDPEELESLKQLIEKTAQNKKDNG